MNTNVLAQVMILHNRCLRKQNNICITFVLVSLSLCQGIVVGVWTNYCFMHPVKCQLFKVQRNYENENINVTHQAVMGSKTAFSPWN